MNTIRNHAHRRRSSWGHWVCLALLVMVVLIAARQAVAGEASTFHSGITASPLEMSSEPFIRAAKPMAGLRGPYLGATTHADESIDELDVRLDLSLSSAGGYTNWYQTGGAFRMTADSPLATDHGFLIDLESARHQLEEEFSRLTVYPLARIGFSIRF